MFYDLAKVAVNRLAFSQGHELAPFGATAVAVTPGWLRSEMMLDAFGVDRGELARLPTAARTAPPDFALSESPRYVGRAVAALAADPDRARWNQQSVDSGRARARVRLHRRRRLAARRLAVHGRHRRVRDRQSISTTIAAEYEYALRQRTGTQTLGSNRMRMVVGGNTEGRHAKDGG